MLAKAAIVEDGKELISETGEIAEPGDLEKLVARLFQHARNIGAQLGSFTLQVTRSEVLRRKFSHHDPEKIKRRATRGKLPGKFEACIDEAYGGKLKSLVAFLHSAEPLTSDDRSELATLLKRRLRKNRNRRRGSLREEERLIADQVKKQAQIERKLGGGRLRRGRIPELVEEVKGYLSARGELERIGHNVERILKDVRRDAASQSKLKNL